MFGDAPVAGAHVAGNGERLWPAAQAIEVATWLAGHDLAIWGGEVYAPRGPFAATMVSEWRTEPGPGPGEPWSGYVGRGLDQALAAIDRSAEAGSLFFLAYHSPAGFPAPAPVREGC